MTDSERDRLDDPREVMARAIYDSRQSYGDLNWPDAEPEDQKKCRTDADDQIAALHAAGLAIVPAKAISTMLDRGRQEIAWNHMVDDFPEDQRQMLDVAYRAMIAAAPNRS